MKVYKQLPPEAPADLKERHTNQKIRISGGL